VKKSESKGPRGFDLDLMMHVDGELESAEENAVASRMDEPGTRGKAAAVRELGELVRGHVELATDEAEPKLSTMWTQLAKRLDNERSAAMSSTAVPVSDSHQGVWGAVGRWFERYRSYVLTSALSAGAVAALALLLRPATLDEIRLGSGNAGTGPVTPTFVSAPPEIESLDVPNGTGTVLTMADEDGGTAIVWVTPDDVEGI
jgi:anti-sigma factor RsiW